MNRSIILPIVLLIAPLVAQAGGADPADCPLDMDMLIDGQAWPVGVSGAPSCQLPSSTKYRLYKSGKTLQEEILWSGAFGESCGYIQITKSGGSKRLSAGQSFADPDVYPGDPSLVCEMWSPERKVVDFELSSKEYRGCLAALDLVVDRVMSLETCP